MTWKVSFWTAYLLEQLKVLKVSFWRVWLSDLSLTNTMKNRMCLVYADNWVAVSSNQVQKYYWQKKFSAVKRLIKSIIHWIFPVFFVVKLICDSQNSSVQNVFMQHVWRWALLFRSTMIYQRLIPVYFLSAVRIVFGLGPYAVSDPVRILIRHLKVCLFKQVIWN